MRSIKITRQFLNVFETLKNEAYRVNRDFEAMKALLKAELETRGGKLSAGEFDAYLELGKQFRIDNDLVKELLGSKIASVKKEITTKTIKVFRKVA